MAMGAPYDISWGYQGVFWEGADAGTEDISFGEISCDHRFDETFGLQVLQGEFLQPTGIFDPQNKSDIYNNIVINETFKKLIGVENPVGMTVTYGGRWETSGKIVGVVNDFYFQPMNQEVKPLILRYNPEMCFCMFIKIDPKKEKEAFAHIRGTYDKMKSGIALLSKRPFMLTSMEQNYKDTYKSVERLQNLLLIFSLLSIVLSFMGIVSMVAFIIEKRTKEIGIRKINGAKWLDIVKEFWREFLLLAAIAAVPAISVSLWVMHRWLQQYVYRISFEWWIPIIVLLFIGSITTLILFLQVQNIAKRNPAECLKMD